jgi:Spy/CpxP family protein refolding chaperone
MKQLPYGRALMLSVLLVLSGVPLVHSGMMEPAPGPSAGGHGGMMGSPMMPGMEEGGMPGMAEPMGRHQPGQLIRRLKTELGLSDAQTTQLRQIFFQAMKTGIQERAQLRVAQLNVEELLGAEPVDMTQVEAKLKESEGLRTRLRLHLIQAHEQAKALLTPEQRQKLEQLHERMPGLMRMMAMMGPEGMGGMGMMRQHPQGMMGPGMRGEMGQGRGPMMQMQGMLQQMAGMMARMAEMQRHLLEMMGTPQPEQP